MKLIVTQKHMNLPKLIVVACSAIALALSGNELSAKAADPQLGNSRRTFGDWCRQKADLNPETKHTVDLLLKIAGTNDCDAADRKLSSLTQLSFRYDAIGDIKPLASLTHLTVLFLSSNKIGDIKPLASLTNLTALELDSNKIGDIKPLASLTNLTKLVLGRNLLAPNTCPLKPESICQLEP